MFSDTQFNGILLFIMYDRSEQFHGRKGREVLETENLVITTDTIKKNIYVCDNNNASKQISSWTIEKKSLL